MTDKFKNVKYLKIDAGVRYWEDASINGVPDDKENPKIPFVVEREFRGEMKKYWQPLIDVDNGTVVNWTGIEAYIHYKVCDDGHYELLDENMNIVAIADDWKGGSYVPTILDCTGAKESYGDYIIMTVHKDGKIDYWNKDFKGFEVYKPTKEVVCGLCDLPKRLSYLNFGDSNLLKDALKKWIDNHSDDDQNAPYLTTFTGKSYTLKHIYKEICDDTDFGRRMASNIISLTIDLLSRGKKTVQD